jgi:hypothetical protein
VYAFIFIILCCFYELLHHSKSNWKWMILGVLVFSTLVSSLIFHYIYKLPFQREFIFPDVFQIHKVIFLTFMVFFTCWIIIHPFF